MESTSDVKQLNYSTTNDSSLFYYRLGWQQIMDEGRYSEAENSYRKALQHDPDFQVAQSVLARLTTDSEERVQIYRDLQSSKSQVSGDERRVLDVYIALTEYTTVREKEPDKAPDLLKKTLSLAEKNLAQVVHTFPSEIYLKCEYIEVLHALYGPEAALDSMEVLVSPGQENNPFLLGYSAHMNAELGTYGVALEKARFLESRMDVDLPKSHAVLADVYFQMDSLELALQYASHANDLDPGNLDASRLQVRIMQNLDKGN